MSARRRLASACSRPRPRPPRSRPPLAEADPARIRVSFINEPDGTPPAAAAPSTTGARSSATGDSLTTVVWRRGEVSVVGTADRPGRPRPVRPGARRWAGASGSLTDARPFVWRRAASRTRPPTGAIGAVVDVNDRGTALGAQGDSITAIDQVVGWVDGALVTPPARRRDRAGVRLPDRAQRPGPGRGGPDRRRAYQAACGTSTRTGSPWGTLSGDVQLGRGHQRLGDVTGVAETASGESHAFLWRRVPHDRPRHPRREEQHATRPQRPRRRDRTSGTAGGTVKAFLWRDGP